VIVSVAPIIVPVMASIAIVFILTIAVMIALVVVVPAMVVVDPAALAFPVAVKESFSVVASRHPAGTFVRRPSPITFVPPVVPAHRIPITRYPHELRAGSLRQNANHASRRRRTDSDSNRNLRCQCGYAAQQHGGDEYSSREFIHSLQLPSLCYFQKINIAYGHVWPERRDTFVVAEKLTAYGRWFL